VKEEKGERAIVAFYLLAGLQPPGRFAIVCLTDRVTGKMVNPDKYKNRDNKMVYKRTQRCCEWKVVKGFRAGGTKSSTGGS
jgi:hypothetical protein